MGCDRHRLLGDETIDARHLATIAVKHRQPTIHNLRPFAEAGVLISYGANFAEIHKRAAVFVDKILKGAWPGETPVEQPTKFKLVINLKTAKALGPGDRTIYLDPSRRDHPVTKE